MGQATPSPQLSIVAGDPLEQEAGMGPLTIPAYLLEVVRRHGPAEALVMRTTGSRISWSYADLLARSLEVSRALVASGLGRAERVGILMTNRPEFLSSLFGVALAGGVPVALSTFSTLPELDYLLKASEVSILLLERQVLKKDFGAMLAELEPAVATAGPLVSARFPYLREVVRLGEPEVPGAEWSAFLSRGAGVPKAVVLARAEAVKPADPGGVFFSSGTTSLPKGVAHSSRAFAIQWWRWPRVFSMKEPVRAWTGNGFFWSGNVSMVVGSALSTGGAVVLQRFFAEDEALDLFGTEKVSFANGRPHQWARLQAASHWASADLSSLKYVTRNEILKTHPTAAHLTWGVPCSFGTTETMTICTSRKAGVDDAVHAGSAGKVLPGMTIKIVDPVTRLPVPLGQKGEMCIKGPTLMTGYLGKAPEECFDAEGFYCTGDGGHIDAEGRFFWDGRLTDMIKTGGANVAPLEVDEAIARLPGVKRTQTVGLPDDLLGEMVVSCVVPVDGASLSQEGIIAALKQSLASFKIPRRVIFLTDAEIGLTGNEKIQPAKAKEMAVAKLGKG